MAYNNPFMNALQQGASVSNQSASAGSQFMNNAINAFNSAGSLSMKMISLLEQEEARKQQQLLQQTQLMHNIYQDAINTQLKQQQLNQQREYQYNTLDIENKKLTLAQKQADINNRLIDAKIASLKNPIQEYKVVKKTNPYTGEQSIIEYNIHNPNDYHILGDRNQITSNNTLNTQNNLKTSLTKEPSLFKDINLQSKSNIKQLEAEIKSMPFEYQKIFFNKKLLQGKTPVEKYSYFKTLIGSNIDPSKFIDAVNNNDIDKLKELYIGYNKNDLISNGSFLKDITKDRLEVIKSINPNMYSNLIDFMKNYTNNVLDLAILHGNTETINDIKSYLKQTLGSNYKKLGFEDLFKNKEPIIGQVNNEYKTLGDINYNDLQDTTGIAGNFISRMFYGYDKNILDSAIRYSGTPTLTKAMYYLDKDYLTSIPSIKKLFTNDVLFSVVNDATNKSAIFADEVNIDHLDPEIKKTIEDINNKFKEQYFGTEKFNKEFNNFNSNNKNFNYDVTQTMPYELYKINKDFQPDLTQDYNKLINLLKKPKYYNTLKQVNNYITKELIELKKLYPDKDEKDLYNIALRNAITDIGKDKVTKAIIYNKLLIKALAERKYKGY